MKREFFIKTKRIGFSRWLEEDIDLAELLWGNPMVTKYICASGQFSQEEIAEKLMSDGLAPDVPVAVVENAARSDMRVLRTALAGLPDLVIRAKVKSPALIIIGDVTARDSAALAQVALEAMP